MFSRALLSLRVRNFSEVGRGELYSLTDTVI